MLRSLDMERAGNFLGNTFRKMKRPEAAIAWLSAVWPSVVGSTLAAHTRPVRCSQGRLEISADAKPWRRQIEGLSVEFSAQVNKAWGSTLVREVKFVASQAELRHVSKELDNDHTPFVRGNRKQR
jgi:predicted nucleic acid-binding Zn ribbon protein